MVSEDRGVCRNIVYIMNSFRLIKVKQRLNVHLVVESRSIQLSEFPNLNKYS